ncbi:MAG: dehydrogenase [Acidobacteria bacterium]|nr:dehydrogenase [Acidobacteriota bacterium]MCI0719530.1 dehydrogenase [Acidobacteriota bacterium]
MKDNFQVGLTADFLSEGKLVFKNIGLSLLERDGIRYRFLDHHAPIVTSDQIDGINALICLTPRITADSLSRSDQLIGIARLGVGYDTVDVKACTAADVALFITAGAVNHSVAEAIVAWMLALSHHVIPKDRLTREGKWKNRTDWMGSELRGKTVGIIGLGGIGSYLVRLLSPFSVGEVIAFDPLVDPERAASLRVRLVRLPELLKASDYVVISCPLTPETRGLIGESELALMKRSAYLVNIARGGIVNEDALADHLVSGGIAGAAIDVFADEPVSSSHRLCQMDNVILAPHSIAWTDEFFEEVGSMCCRQVLTLAAGAIPPGLVNGEVAGKPGFKQKLQRLK